MPLSNSLKDKAAIVGIGNTEFARSLERFAFCGTGKAAGFTQDGGIEIGGRLPMNTSGGLLSEAHLNGWGNHMEIVRQLREEAGDRQIKTLRSQCMEMLLSTEGKIIGGSLGNF